jgi:diguanylate cyclase (GGDEF)-like protein
VDPRPLRTLPSRKAALVRGLVAFCIAGQLLLFVGTQVSLPGTDVVLRAVFSHLILGAAAWLCVMRGGGTWIAVAVGITSWNVGMFVYDALILVRGEPVYPSPADVFFMGIYPALYVAYGLRLKARLRVTHWSGWLDGAAGAAAVAAVAAAIVFEPIRAATGGSFATVLINIAYPLADLLLAAFLILSFAADGWRVSRSQLCMAAGLAVLFVTDAVFLVQTAKETYELNSLVDAGWPAALILMAFAAWQRDDTRGKPARLRGWIAMAAPGGFTLLAVGLLIYGNARPIGAVAVVLATTALLIGAVRTALSFRAIQELAVRRRQAITDELTGMPNRRALYERLDRAIAARRDGGRLAFVLIDLDGFKEVNDSLGHKAGDLLLREIGPRVRDAVRDGDLLARLGGDEFGVLLEDANVDEALAVATRIRHGLERPVDVEGLALMVDASIGIATFPEHGTDAEALLQHADVAMYHAKAARTGCEIYRPDRDESSRDRLALMGQLRQAIDDGDLVLHYQPKADLQTGEVVSVEALVRWDHPQRGLLAPGEFLPVAEQTALMRPLTLRVLDLALADCRRWLDGGRPLGVAVNLAVANLIDRGFPAEVAAALDRHGVPAELVQLEITENVVMADPARALEVLDALRDLGVGLSLDDFGTGHSSLAQLRRLAVDEMKIDRSFVAEMVTDADAAAIVRHTIDLARSLRLRVVAEGAEDSETWEALAQAGCDLCQGYFLSRPLPAAELEAWLGAPVS